MAFKVYTPERSAIADALREIADTVDGRKLYMETVDEICEKLSQISADINNRSLEDGDTVYDKGRGRRNA